MVELRKRKAPPPAPERPAKKTAAPKAKKGAVEKVTDAVKGTVAKVEAAVTGTANGASKAAPEVGQVIDIGDFGGEFETQDGKKVTFKELVDGSKAGVVLFTYPKASTPGCTTQACLFRDGYSTLTSTGLSIFGLSGDSPKANTTFKTKHSFPYDLLCNPSYSLIGAIGMQDKPAKKTKRGVFAVDKSGKVLVAQRGGPQATVDAIKDLVEKSGPAEPEADAIVATAEDGDGAAPAAKVGDKGEDSGLNIPPLPTNPS